MIELNFLPPLGVSLRYGKRRARANMFSNIPERKKAWQLISKENTNLSVTLQFLTRERDQA